MSLSNEEWERRLQALAQASDTRHAQQIESMRHAMAEQMGQLGNRLRGLIMHIPHHDDVTSQGSQRGRAGPHIPGRHAHGTQPTPADAALTREKHLRKKKVPFSRNYSSGTTSRSTSFQSRDGGKSTFRNSAVKFTPPRYSFSTPSNNAPKAKDTNKGTHVAPVSSTMRCYKCPGLGHNASACVNKRAYISSGVDMYHSASEDELEEQEHAHHAVSGDDVQGVPYDGRSFPWPFDKRRTDAVKISKAKKVEELTTLSGDNKEFADLFPEEEPSGLPPFRGVVHLIDFIPGAILPNRTAYQANFDEAKDIPCQVEELLAKGKMQESMSPCAVPVIIVPKKREAYAILQTLLISAPRLVLPAFSNIFAIQCNASGIGISGDKPLAHFNEKINEANLNYATYVLVQFMYNWQHCFKGFLIQSAHVFLKYQKGKIWQVNRQQNLRNWEFSLLYVAFAYNRVVHSATTPSSFGIVYGFNSTVPIDLVPFPVGMQTSLASESKAKMVRELHAKVRKNVEAQSARYEKNANKGKKEMIFDPGDWVWLYFRKDRFLAKRPTKLLSRDDGPFQVLECINNKIDIPADWGVSNTFNVSDLRSFDNPLDLRTDPSQPGESDVNQDTNDMNHETLIIHKCFWAG